MDVFSVAFLRIIAYMPLGVHIYIWYYALVSRLFFH